MKYLKKLLVFALVLMLLVGCGNKTDTPSGTDDTPVILNIATDTDLSTMDHHIATDGTSFVAQAACISGLTELDASGVPQPELASSWDVEYAEDGTTTYTFHLVDAVWSNDTPVTAADFVYGWQRLANPDTASEYSFILSTIKVKNADAVTAGELPVTELGITAVDEKTLQVVLDMPCDFFLGLMAFPSFFPLNQAFYEAQGNQYALSPANMIYCGPFVLTDWTPGNSYTFAKNEKYFDAASVAIDGIAFKFIQDSQSAMLEYESGNLDYVRLTGEMVETYKDNAEYTERLQGYLWYLSINYRVDSLQNTNLRKALAYAIDREKIAASVLKDGSIAAEGIIPKQLSTGPDGKDYRETAGNLMVTDEAQAQAYWEAAKTELGVTTLTIELLFEDTETSKSVAEFIQSEIERVLPDISIELKSQPKKSRLQLMNDGTYEIALTRWGPDYADPQTYFDLYISTNLANNSGRYNSAEYDAKILEATKGESAKDSAARWSLMQEAEVILVKDDAGIIPVYQNGGALMVKSYVKGIELHSVGIDCYKRVTIEK